MKLPLILRAVALLPAFFVMYIIFTYSAQPVGVSKESSMAISQPLLETVFGLGEDEYDEETIQYYDEHYVDVLVRKTAHMLEYATLCVAVIVALYAWDVAPIEDIKIFSMRFTCLYAASDEFHQLFVPGRGSSLLDVYVDTMGGIFGTAIMFAVLKWLVDFEWEKGERRKLK
ncbi:VanZ family protein [Lachnospiraceae bacterium C1.1]|nr:VanZ family protein [Lachnospiraceae bacterium C1.1]